MRRKSAGGGAGGGRENGSRRKQRKRYDRIGTGEMGGEKGQETREESMCCREVRVQTAGREGSRL